MVDRVLSIVTVVKNAREDLLKTIDSVGQQTYPFVEYIVVDGGSADGTMEVIVRSLGVVSKWISGHDSGIYDAMNKGLELATGDYVLFVNAGDVFSSNGTVSEVLSQFGDNDDELCFGKVTVFNKEVEWEYQPYGDQANHGYLPHHQSTFYPKCYFLSERYDTRFRILGDVDYTLRATQVLGSRYIPITTIRTELNGFSVRQYDSLNGIRVYVRDAVLFARKHRTTSEWLLVPFVYTKAIVKYMANKIGGTYLINLMSAGRIRLLGSVHKPRKG